MFLNGSPASAEELKALGLSNYGHFTSMRVEGHRVRGLDLHMDRLVRDCQALFGYALSPDYVRQLIRQAVGDENGSLVVRVTVFDPGLELGHPGAPATPQVLVTTRTSTDRPQPGIRLESTQYQREVPSVKHTGLFATMYHRRQAQLHGFDDVLFVDDSGFISEGATWNIGFIDRGMVIWPDRPCLAGITMKLLDRSNSGTIAAIDLAALGSFEGAFITNAAVGVRPVSAIDGVTWREPHAILDQLLKHYVNIPGELL